MDEFLCECGIKNKTLKFHNNFLCNSYDANFIENLQKCKHSHYKNSAIPEVLDDILEKRKTKVKNIIICQFLLSSICEFFQKKQNYIF